MSTCRRCPACTRYRAVVAHTQGERMLAVMRWHAAAAAPAAPVTQHRIPRRRTGALAEAGKPLPGAGQQHARATRTRQGKECLVAQSEPGRCFLCASGPNFEATADHKQNRSPASSGLWFLTRPRTQSSNRFTRSHAGDPDTDEDTRCGCAALGERNAQGRCRTMPCRSSRARSKGNRAGR